MYNPISLNVIRQAIEWHTDTLPQRIKRQFQQKWPNGNITTIYRLYFPASKVADAIGLSDLICDQDLNPFVELLNACFCDDCHVIERNLERDTELVRIDLYTYFERKESNKPRWKQ
jgi:hypothetical protein